MRILLALKLPPHRLIRRYRNTMAIELIPLPLPASADASKFTDFGREVKGVNPAEFTPEQFKEIEEALYKVRYHNNVYAMHRLVS
jgi:hypothetical protein